MESRLRNSSSWSLICRFLPKLSWMEKEKAQTNLRDSCGVCSLRQGAETNGIGWTLLPILRGGVKKHLFLLLSVKRGGGGLGKSKKSLSENTQICLPFLTKNWGLLPFFSLRVGCCPIEKILIRKKTEVVKKGGGGVWVFLTKVKKTVFLCLP